MDIDPSQVFSAATQGTRNILYDPHTKVWIKYACPCNSYSNSLPMFELPDNHNRCEVPIAFLVPHLQFSTVRNPVTMEQVAQLVMSLYPTPDQKQTLPSLTARRANAAKILGWDAGLANLRASKNRDVRILHTTLVFETVKNDFDREIKLKERYAELRDKRKRAQLNPPGTNSNVLDPASLRTELFNEFKDAKISAYECLAIANHNVELIQKSFCEFSEAAAHDSDEPYSIKKERRFIRMWEEFIDDTAQIETIINRVIVMDPFGGNRKYGSDTVTIQTESFTAPCINLGSYLSKKALLTSGSKKSISDPDISKTDGTNALKILIKKKFN